VRRRHRILAASAALAAYAACGTDHPPTEEAANPTAGLEQAIPTTTTTTTTTTTAPRPVAVKPSRSRRAPASSRAARAPGTGDIRTVQSTAYCLTGVMANGQHTHRGAVAMNGVPLGSRWRDLSTGAVYTVEDRIGHGSGFDIAMPGDCDTARAYGRRTITVERVA
jgi:hypothetical protein